MKKQYNVSRLTDELSKSVFFQKPDQIGQPERNQSALSPKHQVTKAPELQSAIAPSNRNSSKPNNQSAKEQGIQAAKESKQQSTVALKHFSSYLQPGTYKAWKVLATGREMKDYEILQEAMEQYLERIKK